MKPKRPRIRKGVVVASTNHSTYYQIKSVITVEHRYNPMTYTSLGRVLHNTQTL